MIFLDSWIWIEVFQEGAKRQRCKELVNSSDIVVTDPLVLMEVKYKTAKTFDKKKSEEIILTIESFKNVKTLPILPKIAKFAADLRLKYYGGDKQISYADCIHLATAINSGCNKFYSGDPDFKNIKEIETVII